MLTIREVIKTFYNALLQRLKKHRGNWEQNDPTADDYIKNRPFYTGDTVRTQLLSETSISQFEVYNVDLGFAGGSVPVPPFTFEVGPTYIINWNGVEYTCVAQNISGNIGIGDMQFIISNGKIKSGPPFVMAVSSLGSLDVFALDITTEGETRTVSISCIIQEVVKIPSKYLDVAQSDWEVNDSTDPAYILNKPSLATVATSGSYNDLLNKPSLTYVSYNSQSLTTNQKATARNNIGAEVSGSVSTHNTATNAHSDIRSAIANQTHAASDITSGVLAIERGGTGVSSITDTTYTTARYRASTLNSSETTPSINGAISWIYE